MSTSTSQKVKELIKVIDRHGKALQDINECKARLHETEEYFVEMGRKLTGLEKKTIFQPLGTPGDLERRIQEDAHRARQHRRARPKNLPEWF